MKIFIDGDGCPVKRETTAVAEKFKIPVTLVTTHDHYSEKNDNKSIETIYIEKGTDAVDFAIVKLAQSGDIVITQDYGLAALLVNKNIRVLHQTGYEINHINIDRLLEQRHFNQQIRKSGGKCKGPKKFNVKNRQDFVYLLQSILNEASK